MNEELKKREEKVVALAFNALDVHITKLEGEKVNSKAELKALEEAVKLCHQIRSLLPQAK